MKEPDYLYSESPFTDSRRYLILIIIVCNSNDDYYAALCSNRDSAMFDDIDSKDDLKKTSTGL